MSNNFVGVGNSAITKNSADCLLNLLQLNLLGGGNNTASPSANINSNNILSAKPNFYHQSAGIGGSNNCQQQPIIQQQLPPQKIAGRAIINTANLAVNSQQQHQHQPDIFSTNLNTGNELSDFKNALRIISAENSMGSQKPFRNGDGKLFIWSFSFLNTNL